MSSAFDKLMQSGGSGEKRAKAKGGRPKHDCWLGFESVKENGKPAAKCLNCLKVLSNTAAERLLSHR